MKLKLPPVVIVDWIDTTTTSRWESPEFAKDDRPWLCHTVGFLSVMNKNKITLYDTMINPHNGERVGGITTIPRGCVKKIRRLYSGKSKQR